MDNKEKIQLVKQVREKTGLPISDCKKMLEEINYDLNKLDETLEKYRDKIAAKKLERETAEGKIFAELKDNKIYYVHLCCETDFVADNEKFISLGNQILTSIQNGGLKEDFSPLIHQYISQIGENISIKQLGIETANGFYLHRGQKLVAIHCDTSNEQVKRDLCIHIISMYFAFPSSNVEELLKQPWYLNEKITVNDYLNKNKATLNSFVFIN